MADNSSGHEAPTRRKYMKFGGAVLGGGLLAGCAGQSDSGSTPTETEISESTTTSTSEDDSYTVSMAPAGEITFDSIPEKWATYYPGYADMGVALGLSDDLTGVGQPSEYYTEFYDAVPGVSVDSDSLTALWADGIDKEIFYELENDVHLISPENMKRSFDWSDEDLAEITENVGPFIGNRIYRRSDEWHDHRYYTMYEAFEKVAQVFQKEDQYQTFKEFHDEFIADIQSQLPAESDRPSVLLTYEASDEPETFSPYRLDDRGTNKKQWHDLGVTDALANTSVEQLSAENRSELDFENLLTIDPEVLLIRGHEEKSASEFEETVLASLQDHTVASELTAVQNGRVYRGGLLWQGPVQNLFLTEQAAQQLYPDIFGEVTADEKLFDRQRVADIINGNT
ncbi:Fe3+-hydroxamate ABC transporter substrate-binding protein [Haloarcula rubripromontorii]|uniref:Fe3+-hydroxamate ABC transporter substrate-binding protein n=1 Tax=Haloarcula rubripromontorii TaxID=1705562 RepID=A0A0N0U918_9EURY|nr:ABC transporter substrate-binding protein [Haloarcula rubripromontorii]KOX92434.1 Fe3+-hydroxamate ABC transporter substrate-binding protein [Haloarcula rubripromontorii]